MINYQGFVENIITFKPFIGGFSDLCQKEGAIHHFHISDY